MSSLKLGHVWSKTRSLGQILDRPYKRSRFLKYRTAKVIYVTQVSDIGPLGPLVELYTDKKSHNYRIFHTLQAILDRHYTMAFHQEFYTAVAYPYCNFFMHLNV